MKAILTSGVALALLTGAALAQAANPGPAPSAAAAAPAPAPMPGPAGAPPPPPPGGPMMARHQPGGPAGLADRGPMGPDGRLPPPPPPPRGAHVHLQRGDLLVDVKCPDDDAMASCSDAVLRLLDRIQAVPAGAAAPAPAPTAP